jgi:hypothetical protein
MVDDTLRDEARVCKGGLMTLVRVVVVVVAVVAGGKLSVGEAIG